MANRTHNAAFGEPSCNVGGGQPDRVIANFVEGIDDFLLGDVGNFHLVLFGHAGIYVSGNSELVAPLT
jgi:hypothetical protein